MFVPQQDWIVQNSSTTGLGDFELSGDPPIGTSYFPFRHRFGNGATVPTYWVVNPTRTKWEKYRNEILTYGTLDELSRDNIDSSTNSDGKVNWQPEDMPLTIYIVPDITAFEGRYDATNEMFVLAGRKPYTAVGAAFKTFNADTDIAGRFSFQNSNGTFGGTLPALSSVGVGWSVEVMGLEQTFPITLMPNGSDVIDYGGPGIALLLPGCVSVKVWSDGTQWRTDFDYSSWHTLAVTAASAASAVDFELLPYWVNDVEVTFEGAVGTDAVTLLLRTYGADGVLDTAGSDYAYAANYTVSSAANTPLGSAAASSIVLAAGVDAATTGIKVAIRFANIRKTARSTKCNYDVFYLDSAGALYVSGHGGGHRAELDLITGLSIFPSSGTITGTGRIAVRS